MKAPIKIKKELIDPINGNIGEQRRLESISRRQQEERRKKQIISESLAEKATKKHIKFECSSSDEEQNGGEKEKEASTSNAVEIEPSKRCFFLDINDPDIRCPMATFRRHSTEEVLRQKWWTKRLSLVKFYKHERKLALKNLRAQQAKKYGPKEDEAKKGGRTKTKKPKKYKTEILKENE